LEALTAALPEMVGGSADLTGSNNTRTKTMTAMSASDYSGRFIHYGVRGLGEDGPTHQPVEHLAALRAIPNLKVFRPCDVVETIECWQLALESKGGPSVLALTRQNVPQLRRGLDERNRCAAGAYELITAEPPPFPPPQAGEGKSMDPPLQAGEGWEGALVSLFASGSEVAIAVEARKLLAAR